MHGNGTLLKLLIFNHIDHVSHYFRKIWPLHADDIHSILTLNYYLSFETGFLRFAIANVVRILIACRAMCTSVINHACIRNLLDISACQRQHSSGARLCPGPLQLR